MLTRLRGLLPPFGGRQKSDTRTCRVRLLFALLIGNSAGGLAGRLAGGLALAATAFSSALLQIGFVQSFDVFHLFPLLSFNLLPSQFNIILILMQLFMPYPAINTEDTTQGAAEQHAQQFDDQQHGKFSPRKGEGTEQ